MFRLPNIRRSIGTYKVPVNLHEVMTLSIDELLELSKEPRRIEPVDVDTVASEDLKALWEEAAETVEASQTVKPEPLTDAQIAQIKEEPPPCIHYLINKMPPKSDSLNFNKATGILVNYFQDVGIDKDRAIELSAPFIEKYPFSDSYNTPKLRTEHFHKIWTYMLGNFGYFFHCERAKGLRMPGEAYDCLHCLQLPAIEIKQDEPADDQLNFPFQIMTGAAGYFADTFGEVMEAPQHFLFMSYLTCLGSYFAPWVTINSELRTQPRLLTILVGESADERKSTTLKAAVNFFKSVFFDFTVSWGVNSDQGLLKLLKPKETAALVLDKFGTLLAFDEFKQFTNKCRIENSTLLPLVNTLFENNEYESHTKKDSIKLENGFLSILAATTQETYERIYDNHFIAIGFPNRVFIVPGHAERRFSIPQKVSDDERRIMHDHLVQIRLLVDKGIEFDFTEDARILYHEWYLNSEKSVHAKRLDTYSLRLMMLLALNSMKGSIDAEVTQHAIDLCTWQLEVRRLYDPVDADNKVAELEEKVRRLLKKASRTERELRQFTNANRKGLWVFNSALTNLKNAGEITFDTKAKKWSGLGL